jgi:hypothetical protein
MAEKIGVSPAIQKALEALGADAETDAVKDYIAKNYNGVDTSTPSFTSALSTKRKKLKAGGGSTGGRGKGRKATTTAPKPPLQGSGTAKASVVASANGLQVVSDFVGMARAVKEVSDKVGGKAALLKLAELID